MPDHAGFAAAVTVREHTLNVALLAAYANGSFSKVLKRDLLGGPPDATADLFLSLPQIYCEGATGLLVLRLSVWGSVRVKLDGEHVAQITGDIEITIRPAFGPGSSLTLEAGEEDVAVRVWMATVTSAGTPAAVVDYLVGDGFKDNLQVTIRKAFAFHQIKLPSIDVSFFGPLARIATSVDARVRDGALVLGLNVKDDDPTKSIIGDPEALIDFAGINDLAGVVNAAAEALFLDDLHTKLLEGVEDEGATLDRFDVVPAAGFFQVSGAASNSDGTVNFWFRVVPSMVHTRPGTTFQYLPKPRHVKSRTWPALGFHVEGVDTDVDRSWWTIVKEVVGGIFTLGVVTLYVEDQVAAAGQNFSGRVKAADPGAPAARVRRTIPPPGGVAVRIGVDQFEITTAGTFVGISVREIPTPAAMLGPTAVPSTYAGDALRYQIRLPSVVSADDPALRVKWTLEDRTNGVVLIDQDGSAAGRLRFDFLPADFASATDFGVIARVYRRLGQNETTLASVSVNVHMRGPLPPGAYKRWRWEASNPQIKVNEATDVWSYAGEVRVRRWSEWHRTDAPCRSVNAHSRYRFEEEIADRLPYPLRLLESHRGGLCPYCFFGGPAGLNPAL